MKLFLSDDIVFERNSKNVCGQVSENQTVGEIEGSF